MDVFNLALALGSSVTAGLNLYLTVFALGLMQRFELLLLPADLQVLSHDWVLATAGILLLVEFVADKIPYVDNTWDAIHSFVRIPAGAVLAASAVGDVSPAVMWTAALLGGAVSFTSHGAKSSARLAVNSTPEPFSNWFLSLAEDFFSFALLWLVGTYPYLAIALALLMVTLGAAVLYLFFQFFKRIFGGVRQSA